jgi:LDH2 family malate/lactate/ureidoglycolate dehydrogenase
MEQCYDYRVLKAFAEEIFLKIGCSKAHAEMAAEVLIAADLRGIDSHGLARLSGYVRLWETGRVNVLPEIKIIHETPSTATIDGDKGLGLVVAPFAMKVAIEKAKNAGTGWVAVQNSNHFGIAAVHAMLALEHDMVGIAMTNASALVAPTHSNERMLGTNPICVVFPAGEEPPFVADMATTTAANGKLEMLQRKNIEAPSGWIQDGDGKITHNPYALKNNGALLPLGSYPENGSYKGYALGSMVDIFTGVLSGANFGPWVPPFPAYVPMPENQPGKGIGHFFGAMRIDAFGSPEVFKAQMDKWIKRFRSANPINTNQPVIIPGDPERLSEIKRKTEGIPLLKVVIEDLNSLAQKLNLPTI